MSKIHIIPCTITKAREFINEHHRHHKAPQGALFAVGIADESNNLVGVSIIGRPVARKSNDGFTAEITRLCTLGHKNACSMLYGASQRASKALGYKKLVTFTLDKEFGASLKASNFTLAGTTPGKSWSVPSRKRSDKHPLGKKKKWIKHL
jgi:hypothetical protein